MVALAICVNLLLRKSTCPLNLISLNPIVRLASGTPIPDRRVKANDAVLLSQCPPPWFQWRDDFRAAATAADMRGGRKLLRDVQDAFVHRFWNPVAKHRANGYKPHSAISLFTCRLEVTEYDVKRSFPRSK